ncbi:MAG: hypothetical protein PHI07_06490, partial [Candidatus Omnitrophica bacterium]|nr:hypothetical protein [Candidatus Omnitrophota bacterium]
GRFGFQLTDAQVQSAGLTNYRTLNDTFQLLNQKYNSLYSMGSLVSELNKLTLILGIVDAVTIVATIVVTVFTIVGGVGTAALGEAAKEGIVQGAVKPIASAAIKEGFKTLAKAGFKQGLKSITGRIIAQSALKLTITGLTTAALANGVNLAFTGEFLSPANTLRSAGAGIALSGLGMIPLASTKTSVITNFLLRPTTVLQKVGQSFAWGAINTVGANVTSLAMNGDMLSLEQSASIFAITSATVGLNHLFSFGLNTWANKVNSVNPAAGIQKFQTMAISSLRSGANMGTVWGNVEMSLGNAGLGYSTDNVFLSSLGEFGSGYWKGFAIGATGKMISNIAHLPQVSSKFSNLKVKIPQLEFFAKHPNLTNGLLIGGPTNVIRGVADTYYNDTSYSPAQLALDYGMGVLTGFAASKAVGGIGKILGKTTGAGFWGTFAKNSFISTATSFSGGYITPLIVKDSDNNSSVVIPLFSSEYRPGAGQNLLNLGIGVVVGLGSATPKIIASSLKLAEGSGSFLKTTGRWGRNLISSQVISYSAYMGAGMVSDLSKDGKVTHNLATETKNYFNLISPLGNPDENSWANEVSIGSWSLGSATLALSYASFIGLNIATSPTFINAKVAKPGELLGRIKGAYGQITERTLVGNLQGVLKSTGGMFMFSESLDLAGRAYHAWGDNKLPNKFYDNALDSTIGRFGKESFTESLRQSAISALLFGPAFYFISPAFAEIMPNLPLGIGKGVQTIQGFDFGLSAMKGKFLSLPLSQKATAVLSWTSDRVVKTMMLGTLSGLIDETVSEEIVGALLYAALTPILGKGSSALSSSTIKFMASMGAEVLSPSPGESVDIDVVSMEKIVDGLFAQEQEARVAGNTELAIRLQQNRFEVLGDVAYNNGLLAFNSGDFSKAEYYFRCAADLYNNSEAKPTNVLRTAYSYYNLAVSLQHTPQLTTEISRQAAGYMQRYSEYRGRYSSLGFGEGIAKGADYYDALFSESFKDGQINGKKASLAFSGMNNNLLAGVNSVELANGSRNYTYGNKNIRVFTVDGMSSIFGVGAGRISADGSYEIYVDAAEWSKNPNLENPLNNDVVMHEMKELADAERMGRKLQDRVGTQENETAIERLWRSTGVQGSAFAPAMQLAHGNAPEIKTSVPAPSLVSNVALSALGPNDLIASSNGHMDRSRAGELLGYFKDFQDFASSEFGLTFDARRSTLELDGKKVDINSQVEGALPLANGQGALTVIAAMESGKTLMEGLGIIGNYARIGEASSARMLWVFRSETKVGEMMRDPENIALLLEIAQQTNKPIYVLNGESAIRLFNTKKAAEAGAIYRKHPELRKELRNRELMDYVFEDIGAESTVKNAADINDGILIASSSRVQNEGHNDHRFITPINNQDMVIFDDIHESAVASGTIKSGSVTFRNLQDLDSEAAELVLKRVDVLEAVAKEVREEMKKEGSVVPFESYKGKASYRWGGFVFTDAAIESVYSRIKEAYPGISDNDAELVKGWIRTGLRSALRVETRDYFVRVKALSEESGAVEEGTVMFRDDSEVRILFGEGEHSREETLPLDSIKEVTNFCIAQEGNSQPQHVFHDPYEAGITAALIGASREAIAEHIVRQPGTEISDLHIIASMGAKRVIGYTGTPVKGALEELGLTDTLQIGEKNGLDTSRSKFKVVQDEVGYTFQRILDSYRNPGEVVIGGKDSASAVKVLLIEVSSTQDAYTLAKSLKENNVNERDVYVVPGADTSFKSSRMNEAKNAIAAKKSQIGGNPLILIATRVDRGLNTLKLELEDSYGARLFKLGIDAEEELAQYLGRGVDPSRDNGPNSTNRPSRAPVDELEIAYNPQSVTSPLLPSEAEQYKEAPESQYQDLAISHAKNLSERSSEQGKMRAKQIKNGVEPAIPEGAIVSLHTQPGQEATPQDVSRIADEIKRSWGSWAAERAEDSTPASDAVKQEGRNKASPEESADRAEPAESRTQTENYLSQIHSILQNLPKSASVYKHLKALPILGGEGDMRRLLAYIKWLLNPSNGMVEVDSNGSLTGSFSLEGEEFINPIRGNVEYNPVFNTPTGRFTSRGEEVKSEIERAKPVSKVKETPELISARVRIAMDEVRQNRSPVFVVIQALKAFGVDFNEDQLAEFEKAIWLFNPSTSSKDSWMNMMMNLLEFHGNKDAADILRKASEREEKARLFKEKAEN